ncbi:MAG: diguanylate cyclase [Geminicoccaceae bacterium]
MGAIIGYLTGIVMAMSAGEDGAGRWAALHGAADLITVVAGLAVVILLLVHARRRPQLDLGWLARLIALVLAGSAAIHLLDLASLWRPFYGAAGLLKLVACLPMLLPAVLLWRAVRRSPAPSACAAAEGPHDPLQAEIVRRHAAEAELRTMRAVLECRVRTRTHALEAANARLRRSQAQLVHLATHDSLTELPNRRLLHGLLQREHRRAARGHGRFALLLADLDGFKRINDTHGHAAGDAVLAEVARRLRATVRAGDVVARLGGDEFAILVGEPSDAQDLAALMRRLEAAITAPMTLQGRTLQVGVSLGSARFATEDGDAGPEMLLERADRALYAVKARHQPPAARAEAAPRPAALPAIGLVLAQ